MVPEALWIRELSWAPLPCSTVARLFTAPAAVGGLMVPRNLLRLASSSSVVAGTDVFDTRITVPAGRRGPPEYTDGIYTKHWLCCVSRIRTRPSTEPGGSSRSIDMLATRW